MKRHIYLAFVLLLLSARHLFSPAQALPISSQLVSQEPQPERVNENGLNLGNILPLGDSITQGEQDYNSYRYHLHQKLLTAGYEFDFVGSMNQTADCNEFAAQDFDPDHEGHWGWRLDDILEGRQTQCSGTGKLADWLNNYTPDLVLIHLGTNDIFQGSLASSSIAELKQLVQILRQKNPRLTIFLAQLIPTNDIGVNQAIAELNQEIAVLVDEINQPNSSVILVDQYSGFNPINDTYDGIHPNLQGEQKIAQKWFEAIEAYSNLEIE